MVDKAIGFELSKKLCKFFGKFRALNEVRFDRFSIQTKARVNNIQYVCFVGLVKVFSLNNLSSSIFILIIYFYRNKIYIFFFIKP